MRLIKVCLTILTAAVVINFIRAGEMFHLAKILPFANRHDDVDFYDWAGVVVLVIFVWGLYRLARNNKDE